MDTLLLPVLTIHQPWAALIFMSGRQRKRVENRTWAPDLEVPFPLLIHSSSRPLDRDFQAQIDEEREKDPDGGWEIFELGKIIGIVTVTKITTPDKLRFRDAEGPVCWVLSNPKSFVQPVPERGRQKLWWVEVPADFGDQYYRSLALKLKVNQQRLNTSKRGRKNR